ncbi:ribose 5-phosphate epimerase, putative [Plasmodium reichenowi]|uniref:Ribose-5-phosphate isomerase n=10 Tax=Plasmodium (Laverania) TaxID=418107 RepID=RPIA_PLAF7|nr:ribose-5-phosphate isomerase, putative [Plasmodium falciparum 3D7]XP_019970728.1 ribose 5-phosphate epimerase, putative [Plasmodium reichenowi]Q8I3W2.1 RecName: Full=Ribose-5-phosphate isomerase [Plasmodium falciparum 3D7]ETW44572.1 ribose 5-phosphate isomerase A [Plasmodium falciparum NF135/5.C10]EUR77456.1 ribose 5-phosphate isomerase A [Plasmodium falciparum 7G8]EUT90646.1 ribose 5-phosphate isomerase A [Plasmodium falciparum Santa Lucia]KAF4328633.1 ribose-5-phosphate isomerase [Plasmo|eukprot:XP_001351703.1 ribose 5-phosphate epimerase, putative [Plasmodium falciparum 3D7]
MDSLKKIVAYKAVDEYVQSNMTIGLGTGSTVFYVLERIDNLLKSGKLKDVVCIPTSIDTELKARKLGIPLTTLEKHSNIDITIDGTDEIDLNLNLIKGRGGALVREKLVASSSSLFIIIGDESKLCTNGLGMTGAVPIEILTFGYEKIIENLLKIYTLKGCTYKIRKRNGEIFITDNKNYIVDFFFTEPIQDLLETCTRIKMTTGVVDHGIFVNMTNVALISKHDGTVLTLNKKYE